MKKIIELLIKHPDFEEDDLLYVDTVSLVQTPAIGYTWMAFQGEDDDVEMVNGIVELLNKVENIDNRKEMAKGVIKDFIAEEVDFDIVDFMTRVGLDYEVFKKEQLEQVQNSIVSIAEEFGEEHDPELTTYIKLHSFEEGTTVSAIADSIKALDVLTTRKDATEELKEVYKYEGPITANSRKFCRAMVRLSATKFWTRPQINQMTAAGANSDLNSPGRGNYDIFKYAGGARCHHQFVEYKMFKSEDGRVLLIGTGNNTQIPNNAPNGLNGFRTQAGKDKADEANRKWYYGNKGKFQKEYLFEVQSEDQRIVVAPAMVPNNLIRRIDEDGMEYFVYFSKETVSEIAEKYFANNFTNNTNINHSGDVTKTNTILESWIVEDSEFDKSKLYGFNVPQGTWMLSMRINDDDTWNKIKNGELRGYSVEGNFLELTK